MGSCTELTTDERRAGEDAAPSRVSGGVLGLLGLGRRAGHLVIGVDGVRRALQAGQVQLRGRRDATRVRAPWRRWSGWPQAQGVPLVPGPAADAIGSALGRPPVMAVGVRDRALADGVMNAGRAEP